MKDIPLKARRRPIGPCPNDSRLRAVLLCVALGACADQEKVTPVTWEFEFLCEANLEQTDAIRLLVAKGGCPAQEPIFETWASTWESTFSRPQGIPAGEYAFHGIAFDPNGKETASDCRIVTLPMQEVISLELRPTSSCDGRGVLTDPDGGDLADASSPDGGEIEDASSPDAGPCGVWWRDADTDGFGNSSQQMQSCTQPAGYVAKGDDCDDADSARHPGATEFCDTVDSDCDGLTTEGCPSLCTPLESEDRLYWVCDTKLNWADAALVCTSPMTLVRIDSPEENQFLLDAAFPLLKISGGDIWIGASDTAEEGVWRWVSGGDVFWRGGNADDGGMPENSSIFTRFKDNEPSGGLVENCGQLRSGSLWNDGNCETTELAFVCERQ